MVSHGATVLLQSSAVGCCGHGQTGRKDDVMIMKAQMDWTYLS